MKYTTRQLESIIWNDGLSHAFQRALRFVKERDEEYYKLLLLTEIDDAGLDGDLEELYMEEEL
jgi:hypothetical protein